MRAIWKGAVSFGLVSIGVRLYSATEEKDIRFHQVHRTDGGRIRYKRVCSVDGEEVSYDDIAKGYDLGGGEMVVLTDEDFADLPLTTSRAIEVLEFVPADQVDPMLYAKAYYLEPEGTATKPYALLREALADVDRVAIVKVALRQREQLATLRVKDNVLVLNTMLWPEVYTDNYREALQEVIDAKVEGREVVAPPEEEGAPTAAVDLMAALRASVDRARAARGESGPAEPTPITSARSAKKAPAKKAAPAKKTADKKATEGKEPAKKAAAKKTPAKKAAKKTARKSA